MAKRKPSKSSSKKSTPRKKEAPTIWNNRQWHQYLILIFGFLLYANTIPHDYTQDDAIVITENEYTTQGLAGIPGLLKYDTFKGFFKTEGKDKLVAGGRYRPLTPILFALEWQLTKKQKLDANGQVIKDTNGQPVYEGRPWFSHFVNALLYGLTGLVLYWLLLRLMPAIFPKGGAPIVALLATLLFLAHPLHTEAVANIKGRDEIVSLLGSLATALLLLKAYAEQNFKLAIYGAIIFFLALLAKENTITYLAVIPLMFYFFTKADASKIVRYSSPLLAATVVFLLIRFSVLNWSFGEETVELMNNPFVKIENNQYVPFSTGEKSATIMYTLGKYLQLLFVPQPLTHDYYPRHVEIMQWSNWQVLLSFLVYLGLLGWAIRGVFKKDPISFCILYYLATLSIVSNIVFPVGTNMSERFMFMPSIGWALAIAILLYKWQMKNSTSLGKLTMPVLGVAAAIILLFSGKTLHRNQAWKDNFTLFTTDIQTSQRSAKLQNAVGGELIAQALQVKDQAKQQQMFRQAVPYLNKALEIHPNFKNSYLQLGNVHNYLKEYEKSVQYYEQVLRLSPNDPNGLNNMGITYREAGQYYGQEKGDLQKAISYLEKAYQLRPNDYEVLRLMGTAYGIKQDYQRSLSYFQKSLEINPKSADALWNIGNTYYFMGDLNKANSFHQRAAEIDPTITQRRNQN